MILWTSKHRAWRWAAALMVVLAALLAGPGLFEAHAQSVTCSIPAQGIPPLRLGTVSVEELLDQANADDLDELAEALGFEDGQALLDAAEALPNEVDLDALVAQVDLATLDPALLAALGLDARTLAIALRGVPPPTGPRRCTTEDGRVNAGDRAAAATIYCTARGVEIYDINLSSDGELRLRVSWRTMLAAPRVPRVNTLLAEAGGFQLYKLTSGEFQLNSPPDWEGKSYVFVWDGCIREE